MIQAAESKTHNSGSYWPTGFHFSYCLFFRLRLNYFGEGDSAFETKLLFRAFQKENVFQLSYLANRPLK